MENVERPPLTPPIRYCIAVNEDGFPYANYDNCKGCIVVLRDVP